MIDVSNPIHFFLKTKVRQIRTHTSSLGTVVKGWTRLFNVSKMIDNCLLDTI